MASPFCAKDVIDKLKAHKRNRRRKREASHDTRSSSRPITSGKTGTEPIRMLPLGFFIGATVFRNSLHHEEKIQDGFLSLSNLVPPDWSRALATTFGAPETYEWLESVVNSRPPQLEVEQQFVLVHHGPHPIGEAKLAPIRIRRRRKNGWYTLSCQPHTGGCMHPKILLFRTPRGLRVIVSGNNFYQSQWENDRDCLWAQDFLIDHKGGYDEGSGDDLFPLKPFLRDLCQCQDGRHQTFMDEHLRSLFDQIDFSSAKASLVFSFPRFKDDPDDRGGWRQLTRVVQDRMLDDYDTENDNNSPNTPSDTLGNSNKSVLYTMSGSTGDVDPTFLKAMQSAMSGQDTYLDDLIAWESLKDMQCLIPSYKTAQTMNPIWNGRLISRSHWYTNIPKEARRRIFNDAIPNPSTRSCNRPYLPFAHAKVMFFQPRRKSDAAVLYVGSHNFSKAAWGITDKMPTNVEVGVVLSTVDPQLQAEWEARLPYLLPAEQIPQGKEYTPVFQGDLKHKLGQIAMQEARS
jgi:hypothetical protein